MTARVMRARRFSANSLNTITVTATNGFGLTATATVDILTAPGPSISIGTPKDNTFYPSSAAGPDAVTGTIVADGGSTVQVNGVQATVNVVSENRASFV